MQDKYQSDDKQGLRSDDFWGWQCWRLRFSFFFVAIVKLPFGVDLSFLSVDLATLVIKISFIENYCFVSVYSNKFLMAAFVDKIAWLTIIRKHLLL